MYTCKQSEEVSAYIDDELPASARRSFEAHVGSCTACRDEVVRIQRLRTGLRNLPPRTVGYDLAPLLRARAARRPPASPARRVWRLPLFVPLSSALAATICIGIYLGLVIGRPVDDVSPVSKLVLLDPVPACSASISALVLF